MVSSTKNCCSRYHTARARVCERRAIDLEYVDNMVLNQSTYPRTHPKDFWPVDHHTISPRRQGWELICFLLEYGTSAHVIIRVFTHCFALLICIHFLIAVVIHHYF